MLAKIKLWTYGAIAAMVAAAGLFLYRSGAKNAKQDMMEDDFENAQDIRRRVSVDRAKRVRELDDSGWRD